MGAQMQMSVTQILGSNVGRPKARDCRTGGPKASQRQHRRDHTLSAGLARIRSLSLSLASAAPMVNWGSAGCAVLLSLACLMSATAIRGTHASFVPGAHCCTNLVTWPAA